MQVDPIKPTLKAPGTKRLKLQYDEPPSSFALKFKLRRYIECAGDGDTLLGPGGQLREYLARLAAADTATGFVVGAYTRPLLSST